jgi:hypothetical protein
MQLFNLKGDVSRVDDSTFVVDSAGKVMPDSVALENGEYVDGFVVRFTGVDTTGKNKIVTNYEKYENGFWKSIVTYTNDKLTDSVILNLDSSGKYAIMFQYDSSRRNIRTGKEMTQSEYGLPQSANFYDSTGKLRYSFKDTYDTFLLTESIDYDSSGKIKTHKHFKLNEKGDPIQEITITTGKDSTTSDTLRFEYRYDAIGNWIERTNFGKNSKPVKIVRRNFVYNKAEE